MKKNELKFTVSLDENQIPEKIEWTATDTEEQGGSAGAFMAAIWDRQQQQCLKIDLWDKEHTIDDMKRMVHQSILTMADTFERATGEKNMAGEMRDFGHYFALQMKLVEEG